LSTGGPVWTLNPEESIENHVAYKDANFKNKVITIKKSHVKTLQNRPIKICFKSIILTIRFM
jgi:hypothetical protein